MLTPLLRYSGPIEMSEADVERRVKALYDSFWDAPFIFREREPTPEEERIYKSMRDLALKYNITILTAREPELRRVRRSAALYDDLTFFPNPPAK